MLIPTSSGTIRSPDSRREVNSLKVGDVVTFVDATRGEYPALLTAVHDGGQETPNPSVNLVYVSPDDSQRDPYGRQIARSSSVVHESHQAAAGMFWRQ
jgi:hypothetical protein